MNLDRSPESEKTIRRRDSQTERMMTHLKFTRELPDVSFLALAAVSKRQRAAPAALCRRDLRIVAQTQSMHRVRVSRGSDVAFNRVQHRAHGDWGTGESGAVAYLLARDRRAAGKEARARVAAIARSPPPA